MGKSRVLGPAAVVVLLAASVVVSLAQQNGYYVLDGFGGVHAGGVGSRNTSGATIYVSYYVICVNAN